MLIASLSFAQTAPAVQATTAQPPAKDALRLVGNGVRWTSLEDSTKDTFVDGYVMAMIRVNHMVAAQCASDMKNLHPGAQFDAEMNAAMALCVNAEFFDFSIDERLDRQKVKNGVDDFYKDSQNSRIPIDYAMAYVKDTLKGKRAPRELEDELKGWRSTLSK